MSVGGHIIEITDYRLETGRIVKRLWVVDRTYGDETCVYAEPADIMPQLGDEIWWQSGKIYFDKDHRYLTKVGYSFAAPGRRS